MATLRAKVTSHTRVSDPGAAQEIFLLRLTAPEIAQKARPGQFVMLKVAAGIDPLLARPFSVHGVEGGDLLILYRLAGKGTRLLSEVKEGGELTLWGPLGKGFELMSMRSPALVAGGIGMAPLAFAAKFFEDKGRPPKYFTQGGENAGSVKKFLKIISNQLNNSFVLENISGIKFDDIVKGWVINRASQEDNEATKIKKFAPSLPNNTFGDIILTAGFNLDMPSSTLSTVVSGATIDGSFGIRGTVVDQFKDFLIKFPNAIDGVLTCGPIPMLKAVARLCAEHKVPCQVSLEAPMACGVGACLGCAIPAAQGGYLRACQEGPVMDAALVDWERL